MTRHHHHLLTTELVPCDWHRRRGRPRRRWWDDMDHFWLDWRVLANNRDEWKKTGMAFAQQLNAKKIIHKKTRHRDRE